MRHINAVRIPSNTKIVLILLLAIATTSCNAKKKDRNLPHGHKGKLRPYKPGPFAVKLTAADEATLRSGHPVTKQTVPADPSAPGTVLCIQDVEAPLSAVWSQILDMDQYHKKVSKVTECRNYFVSKLSGGRVTIKTKQVLGVLPGYSVRKSASFSCSLLNVATLAHNTDIVGSNSSHSQHIALQTPRTSLNRTMIIRSFRPRAV
jgi:hypothetical protein